MKTQEIISNPFKGILSDKEAVINSFENAGVKAHFIWQFGEPVEVEEWEESEADFSLPLVNATVSQRSFFWL